MTLKTKGPASATGARTDFPSVAWAVNNGPLMYTVFNPITGVNKTAQVTYGGVNYVRQLITPFTPTKNADGDGVSHKWNSGDSLLNDTTWMDGKLDTLIGVRYDHSKEQTAHEDATEMRKPDFSAGLVYHVLPWLAPYVSAADFWQPGGDTLLDGGVAPNSHATSIEAGLKLNSDEGKISGSLSVYHSMASDFEMTAPALAADVSPTGLNGQIAGGTASDIAADVETNGVSVQITATPVPNWRMRLSAAWTPAKFTSGAEANQVYNDQFYENSAGDVTYADGTIVYVPATFNKSQLTTTSTAAGAVPLTVALLSTPSSQYYADPAAVTGALSKSSNGGLVLVGGGSSTHGPILTGVTGLPISDYQLNTGLTGIVPVGSIDAAIPGAQTWGFPQLAFNFTSVYEFPSGWLKGFKIGGTVAASWRNLVTYWYASPTGLAPSQAQQFFDPTLPVFNLISGYERKFGRYLWSVQLNINNMFNTYKVLEYPNPVGGYSTATSITANLDQQPRMYFVTTTLHF